jgi:hypothetical protein
MDKRIAGLLGAAAVTALGGAQANAAPAQAANYADLLQPVPNAVSELQADNARLAAESDADADAHVQLAQYHHHHHHHWRRYHHHHHHWRRHYHHHHHHHHAGFGVIIR